MSPPATSAVIERETLTRLMEELAAQGHQVLGPVVRDGAIIYDRLRSVEDLPAGWSEEQEAGRYRLKRRSDAALFGYAVGPRSWKQFLHPPVLRLWQARREDRALLLSAGNGAPPKFAFVGVRACELHALAIQDRVFLGDPHVDPVYRQRREAAFILAVNCTQAGGTCFCASMNTGPKATFGFDLALTELLAEDRHGFLVEVGSERGQALLDALPHAPAPREAELAAQKALSRAASQMGRTLDTAGLKELLYRNYEHPRWDHVAARCLTCANCTMVCPTCFCATVEDHTDLSGQVAERWRRWDSCFTTDFSYIHGGSVRASSKARYRQWLTHKLATWFDQFGTSGCVGCGRCITWCPAGIDITEEVRAIRQADGATLTKERQP
jgi:ferredoxin